MNSQIGFITLPSCDPHILRLIQCINKRLLDFLVGIVIQSIDPDSFLKNLLKIRPDLRSWKCDDGKTGLISGHILVHDLPGCSGIGKSQLLLVII